MGRSAFQPILDSAERAMSAENYASAESLLREAARQQTKSLGPTHPALASTYNNLGIVCEKANKLDDAGHFYQQAFVIASASLDSEDPLVVTSRQHFTDFCRIHGMVDAPAASTIDAATTVWENLLAIAADPASVSHRRAIAIGAVMGVVIMGAVGIWLTHALLRAPVSPPSVSSQAGNPPQPLTTSTSARPQVKSPKKALTKASVTTGADEDLRVVEASLCQTLSTTAGRWECMSASDPRAAGSLYFYTRIASPTSVRIHHRWYRDGRLRRTVDLAVQANPSSGYRTYSRQRIDAGQWRVEAVAPDGKVLHQEQIAIP